MKIDYEDKKSPRSQSQKPDRTGENGRKVSGASSGQGKTDKSAQEAQPNRQDQPLKRLNDQPGKPGGKPQQQNRSNENQRVPRAAKGDDDLMSKQQRQAMPSADQIKGEWKQKVGAAKIMWGKLTDDELMKTEGRAEKLAGLVQARYAMSRGEADRQIKSFFADYKR
jgi:uncharacterized protein YjbJ (UPF0337 family)